VPEEPLVASNEMTIDERRKCLAKMRGQYAQGSKQQRSQLLDEMEAVTVLHRKSLLRLLHAVSVER